MPATAWHATPDAEPAQVPIPTIAPSAASTPYPLQSPTASTLAPAKPTTFSTGPPVNARFARTTAAPALCPRWMAALTAQPASREQLQCALVLQERGMAHTADAEMPPATTPVSPALLLPMPTSALLVPSVPTH